MPGRVFIGQLGSRGKDVSSNPPPEGDFYRDPDTRRDTINVTSTNGKTRCGTSLLRDNVSPFYIKTGDGYFFENWWQSGKVFDAFLAQRSPPRLKPSWQKFRDTILTCPDPVRHPGAHPDYKSTLKGMKPVAGYYDGAFYEYVASRLLYARQYAGILTANHGSCLKRLRSILDKGQDLFLLDFDGPPSSDYPHGVEVTQANYDKFANYAGFRFGHGWVLAGILAGIDLTGSLERNIAESNRKMGDTVPEIMRHAQETNGLVRAQSTCRPVILSDDEDVIIASDSDESDIIDDSETEIIAKLKSLGPVALKTVLQHQDASDPVRRIMVDRVRQILTSVTDCQERTRLIHQASRDSDH